MKTGLRLLLLCLVIVFAGCEKRDPIKQLAGRTMGTTYSVKYYGDLDKKVGKQLIDDELKAVNNSMSTYIKDSELSLLNKDKSGKAVKVSRQLFKVLDSAVAVSKQSQGAFDVTVGPAVNLWGFGPDGKRRVPNFIQVKEVLKNIGYQNIELDYDGFRIKKLNPNIYIDLGAIAKGHGVDRVGLLLEKNGIRAYMVEIGGEVRTRGIKSNGAPWKIGIESPKDGREAYTSTVNITGKSIATSGNYRNFFKSKGKFYSHTIDPKTAKPVSHKLISASVIHDNCMTADALATALMVLGPKDGVEFIQQNKLAAFLIYEEETKLKTYSSPTFSKYVSH